MDSTVPSPRPKKVELLCWLEAAILNVDVGRPQMLQLEMLPARLQNCFQRKGTFLQFRVVKMEGGALFSRLPVQTLLMQGGDLYPGCDCGKTAD